MRNRKVTEKRIIDSLFNSEVIVDLSKRIKDIMEQESRRTIIFGRMISREAVAYAHAWANYSGTSDSAIEMLDFSPTRTT